MTRRGWIRLGWRAERRRQLPSRSIQRLAGDVRMGRLSAPSAVGWLVREAHCDEATARRALIMELGGTDPDRIDGLLPLPEYGL